MHAAADEAWQLKIPIRLALSQDEITSPGDVQPVYLLAPRFAYLPALAQQSLAAFQHVLLSPPGEAAQGSSPWFEFDGLALSWTQPLGVLHDLLTVTLSTHHHQHQQQQKGGPTLGFASGGSSSGTVPWCLRVHYRNQPTSLSNGWQNAGSAKDHYFSSLKEAGFCCRGTDGCNAVMGLNGASQDALWGAINGGDGAATARRILGPLRLSPSQRQGSAGPTAPVRLYIRQHQQPGSDSSSILQVWEQVFSTSRAVELQQPDGSATLLAHLLHMVMPQRFPALAQQQQQQPDSPAAEAVSTAVGGPDDPLGALSSSAHPQQQQQQPGPSSTKAAAGAAAVPPGWPGGGPARVLVCGVSPDWSTPLGWLHANFRAADGFLYVVVHVAAAAGGSTE